MRCPACQHDGLKRAANTTNYGETIWRQRYCKECGTWFETEERILCEMNGNDSDCAHETSEVVTTEYRNGITRRVRHCKICDRYYLTEEKPFHIRAQNNLMRQRWLERKEAKHWRQLNLFDEAVQ